MSQTDQEWADSVRWDTMKRVMGLLETEDGAKALDVPVAAEPRSGDAGAGSGDFQGADSSSMCE